MWTQTLPSVLAFCFSVAGLDVTCLAQEPGSQIQGGEAGTRPSAQRQQPEAQDKKPTTLPTVIVTAFRSAHDPFELPRSVTYMDQENIERRDKASILDTLNRSIGI